MRANASFSSINFISALVRPTHSRNLAGPNPLSAVAHKARPPLFDRMAVRWIQLANERDTFGLGEVRWLA
jgi:hypothetical protein